MDPRGCYSPPATAPPTRERADPFALSSPAASTSCSSPARQHLHVPLAAHEDPYVRREPPWRRSPLGRGGGHRRRSRRSRRRKRFVWGHDGDGRDRLPVGAVQADGNSRPGERRSPAASRGSWWFRMAAAALFPPARGASWLSPATTRRGVGSLPAVALVANPAPSPAPRCAPPLPALAAAERGYRVFPGEALR